MLFMTLALCAAATAAEPTTTFEFSGIARTDDGAIFYREDHRVKQRNGVPVFAETTYRDPGGRVIATLRTDFSKDRFAPSYEMRDADGRVVRSVKNAGRSIRLAHGSKRADLPATSNGGRRLVTGQGLDQYARYYRAALASGQELGVRFPIPTRLDMYDFRLRAIDTPRPEVVRVEIEVDNFILALLAPSIIADYDRETGRLVRYYGVSNLTDENGDNPMVEIVYEYGGTTS
jgi:hypothetical protein